MSKKRFILVFAAVVVILIGIGLGWSRRSQQQVLHAKKGDLVEAIYGLGKVRSDETFELKLGVIANISKLYVREGDLVQKGEKMVAVEATGVFKAPFTGTVTSITYQEGEIITPQAPILRLENLERNYIEVSLEQEAALKVRPGQSTQLVFESILGAPIEGKVKNIYPKKGEFIAHIDVEKLNSNILPGMTADVVIQVGNRKGVTLIPVKAISGGQVVRRRDGKKEKIVVEVGRSDGIWAELLKGDLQISDELLVKGK